MRRAAWVSAAAVVAVGAYVGLDIADIAPGVLTTDHPIAAPPGAPAPAAPPAGAPAPSVSSGPSGGPGGSPAGTSSPTGVRLVLADPAALPLPVAGTGAAMPTPAAVAAALTPLLADRALGSSVGVVVRDGLTGQALLEARPAVAHTPASTTKLVTAAAIASSLPMSTTLDTAAVQGPGPNDVVLVAGGDTLLGAAAGAPWSVAGQAGLGDLADQVVAARAASGVSGVSGTSGGGAAAGPVRVLLDEGPLAGPRIDPAWESVDVAAGYAGPVAPLGLATDRPAPGHDVPADPALAAAAAFRAALAARGVVVAPEVARGPAPAGAARLGVIRSAAIGDQLALALADSDNTLTSALARVAAVRAGTKPAFADVSAWVVARVATLGVPTDGLVIADPSGLAPGSRASAATLAGLLHLATSGAAPELLRVYADLPAAGLVGTLATRYRTGPQRDGAGLVRAKTGTLTGVSSLAGTVVDADGRLLVFAILADKVPADGTDEARVALDKVAATLAACGCR